VALTDSTARQDPLALTARGSALLTLGHAAAERVASNEPSPPTLAARRKQTQSALSAPSVERARPVSSPVYSNAAPAGESH
jgi:hypothetical protein